MTLPGSGNDIRHHTGRDGQQPDKVHHELELRIEVGKPRRGMREGRRIRAEHIAGHQRHRTERHRPAETSPQPLSWLMVPERDPGMRAPESHYFVAMPAAGCAACGSCWQMDEIAGLIMEAGRKASGRSQLISSKLRSPFLDTFIVSDTLLRSTS